ncbi:MAG TPA: c-type cytochrome [Bryobacteraceae bacterium]|nr:c-type cytochrome [Bryobacteraceae bacterium]
MNTIRFGVAAFACGSLGILLLAQEPSGDAARGKAIYEGKGDCASCHRINGVGGRLGPDLSDIGVPRGGGRGGGGGGKQATPAPAPTLNLTALETSIVDPDAEVALSNRLVRIVTKDGKSVTGKLLNHDNFTVQFIDPQGKLHSYVKADLKESTVLTKGLMPSYKDRFSAQEVADVVAYLATLKGPSGSSR